MWRISALNSAVRYKLIKREKEESSSLVKWMHSQGDGLHLRWLPHSCWSSRRLNVTKCLIRRTVWSRRRIISDMFFHWSKQNSWQSSLCYRLRRTSLQYADHVAGSSSAELIIIECTKIGIHVTRLLMCLLHRSSLKKKTQQTISRYCFDVCLDPKDSIYLWRGKYGKNSSNECVIFP